MPAFEVSRSVVVDRDIESVFDTVVDFSRWTKWSPWLCIDHDAVVTVSDNPNSVGSTYHWKGELVGEGELEHLTLERPNFAAQEIRFLKPFKSISRVEFTFRSVGDSTEVTWKMLGNLPWFMFWMKANMEIFIGMDYERGLRMLKELIETGEVPARTDIRGIEATKPRRVIGLRTSCALDGIGPSMQETFSLVDSKLGTATSSADTEMISVYHTYDMKNRTVDYTSGYVVTADAPCPSGLVVQELEPGNALAMRHTGAYEHLGNTWSGAHQYARYKKIKLSKSPGFEIYRNNPSDTARGDLVTDVYVATR